MQMSDKIEKTTLSLSYSRLLEKNALFDPRVKLHSETTEVVQSADEHSWLERVLSCQSKFAAPVNVLTKSNWLQ